MKWLKYMAVILIIAIIQLYLCVRFIHQLKEFNLRTGPLSFRVLEPGYSWVYKYTGFNKANTRYIILARHYGPDKIELRTFDLLKELFLPDPEYRIALHNSYQFLSAHHENQLPVFNFVKCNKNDIALYQSGPRSGLRKIRDLEPIDRKFPKYEGQYGPISLADLDNDGQMELLVQIRTHYFRYPKGLACYNPDTGALQWVYYMGALIDKIMVRDLDNDQKKEIVLSTNANNNGSKENGTDDSHSYVIVLDHQGNELWKQITGSWYTYAQSITADLDNDGYLEIVATTKSHQVHNKKPGRIFLFDGSTGKIKFQYVNKEVSFTRPFAWNTDTGEPRIAVADSSGFIRLMDGNLNITHRVKEPYPAVILNSSSSLQPANDWQYIFIYTQHYVTAYDYKLEKRVFQYNYPKVHTASNPGIYSTILLGKTTANNHGFVFTDNLNYITDSNPGTGQIFSSLIHSGVLLTLAIFLLINGFMIYTWFRIKRNPFTSLPEEEAIPLKEVQDLAYLLKTPVSTILWSAEKLKRISTQTDGKSSGRPAGKDLEQIANLLLQDAGTLKQLVNQMVKSVHSDTMSTGEK